MPTPPLRPFMTVAEVARALRVDSETVRRWIRKGTLPAYKPVQGKVMLVEADDVKHLICRVASDDSEVTS